MTTECLMNVVQRIAAAVVLMAVLPVVLAAAVWIRAGTGPPALYRSCRLGRHRRVFIMFKLRTMHVRRDGEAWPRTSMAQDQRLIQGGRWLRRYKIDELPQLWNIVRGEMAFVGPRPELAEDAERYGREDDRVFSVLPGLTDLASLRFMDMAGFLASKRAESATGDPDTLYMLFVQQERRRLRRRYIDTRTPWLDLRILAGTATSLILGRVWGGADLFDE